MISGIIASLVTEIAAQGAAGTKSELRNRLRKGGISTHLSDVETTFHGIFKKEIRRAGEELDNIELVGFAIGWENIVNDELIDEEIVTSTPGEAIEKLSKAILESSDTELNQTSEQALKEAVCTAYEATMEEFARRLDKEGLADELQLQTDFDLLGHVTELKSSFKELEEQFAPPRAYQVVDFPDASELLRERWRNEIDIEPVRRIDPEQVRGADNILIHGPEGCGKTTLLGEVLEYIDFDCYSHLFLPSEHLSFVDDTQAIRRESFTGDVLLVWDHIHGAGGTGDGRVFEGTIDRLRDRLSDKQKNLDVIATVDSGQFNQVPKDIEHGRQMWADFYYIDAGNWPEEATADLIKRYAAYYDVDVDDEMRQFLQANSTGSTAPMYIREILRRHRGTRLPVNILEEIPETLQEMWVANHDQLRIDNDA